MAPTAAGTPSQADTPMTDANDDAIPSVPVDALTVRDSVSQSNPSSAIVALPFCVPVWWIIFIFLLLLTPSFRPESPRYSGLYGKTS